MALPLAPRALLLTLTVALAGACGDDDDIDATPEVTAGAEPTIEACFDQVRAVVEAFEVPDGVVIDDGVSDEEGDAIEAAGDEAARSVGIDPDDEDAPCDRVLADAPVEQLEAFVAELGEEYPEVVELLGLSVRQQFSSISDSL